MMNLELANKLTENLEEAAFLVAEQKSTKKAHSKIIDCLLLVNQIKTNETSPKVVLENIENDEVKKNAEVRKVRSRLESWIRKPEQCNSRILNAFLELRREGNLSVTENDLQNKIGPNTWFKTNFAQMRNFAERNHGKIFHKEGSIITIWEPVLDLVNNYETRLNLAPSMC